MNTFNGFLKQKIEEYIQYRKQLGFTDKSLKSRLKSFDQYVVENKSDWESFTPSYFLKLRENLNGNGKSVNDYIRIIKGFFQFLVRHEIVTDNPVQDIPTYPEDSYIPFIFSESQTNQLLLATQNRIRKTPSYFLTDLAIYLSLLLLARCGVRISEPLGLLCEHYRPKEGSLYIEKTKFRKDRLIPVPQSVVPEINNYLSIRKSLGIDSPYLIVGSKNKISSSQICRMFHQSVKDISINQPKRRIANTTFGGPTPHSLRHSFAINTLKLIKQRGQSPHDALPVLSAYLGHRKYRYTSVYLKVLDAEHRQGLVDFSISKQEEV